MLLPDSCMKCLPFQRQAHMYDYVSFHEIFYRLKDIVKVVN